MRAASRLELVRLAILAGSLRALLRAIAVLLGLRQLTPRPGELLPSEDNEGPVGDTGGGGWYRPAWRRQDPSYDPEEPYGGESSGRGDDHGWSNCTMTSGAMALDFATLGELAKWGGHMRHHQSDLEGGTDLYDLRTAFEHYGESLTIRSGGGWEAWKADLAEGRALVVQGSGPLPGSATYTGGHACLVHPERSGDKYLFGDPLTGGFQWVTGSSIKDWMTDYAGSGLAWARTVAHPPGGGGSEDESMDHRYANPADGVVVVGAGRGIVNLVTGRVFTPSGRTFTAHARVVLAEPIDDEGEGESRQKGYAINYDGQAHLVLDDTVESWTPTEDPPPAGGDVDEAVAARDAEWLAHLTPDG